MQNFALRCAFIVTKESKLPNPVQATEIYAFFLSVTTKISLTIID